MDDPEPVHVLVGGNQNAGKSSIINVLCQGFGCLPFLTSRVPKTQASTSTAKDALLRPRPDLPPSSFHIEAPQCCIEVEAYHRTMEHGTDETGSGSAAPRPRPLPAVQTPTDGILAPEGNCSHTTWLRTNYIITPVQSWGDASVSVEVVYHSAEYVLNAMLAAHRVCDQAEAAASTDGGYAAALAVLGQHEALLNTGLQFRWPTNPYSTLRSYVKDLQQQQQQQQQHADAYSSATAAAQIGFSSKNPQGATAMAAAASSAHRTARLIEGIRASLKLTPDQWHKLGCVETLQLPHVLADGQRCTYGAAIHDLLNRHVWVRTTGDDPEQWLGNRHLRLISHVNVNVPAAVSAPHVVLIDSQGREQTPACKGPYFSPTESMQQQSGASRQVNWSPMPAKAVDVDGIVYVVKEHTESGVAFIQDEFSAEALDAWVQVDLCMQRKTQVGIPAEGHDKVTLKQTQQPSAPCLLVLIMGEKLPSDIYSKVGRYQFAKDVQGSNQTDTVRLCHKELLEVVNHMVQDSAGVKSHLTSLITSKLASMLLGAKGVPVDQENEMAARIVSRHMTVHHVFPWCWAGEAITSRDVLKGIQQGELLTWEQSGLQALNPLLFCKQPAPTPVSDRLLQSGKEAEQQLQRLLTQQRLAIATPPATSPEQVQQLRSYIHEYFLQPALGQLEAHKVKLQGVIQHMKDQVCDDWHICVLSCKAANKPARSARRLLGALHVGEHVIMPTVDDSDSFSKVVAEFEEVNQCCAFTGHDLADLLKNQQNHPKSAAQLLFPAFLEDKMDRQDCVPAPLRLPPIAELSSVLLNIAESAASTPQAQTAAPAHASVPNQQEQEKPPSATLRMHLQGIVADLASLAVTASQQIQQQYSEPSSGLKPLQQQVLQVCQTLVKDLAIRLAHTSHMYLESVLNDRWRAGWAIHEVYEKQGMQQQLEERLAAAASAVVSRNQVTAEWFEWLIYSQGHGNVHTEAAGSSASASMSLPGSDNADLLTWFCGQLSRKLSATSNEALDDLQSAFAWLCEDWSCCSRNKIANDVLLFGTTATAEVAWKQAVQLTFTGVTLRQLAADLVAKDSNQLNGYTEAASASWGPQVATAGSSAAAERREHQCWQCPLLHTPLTAATTSLLQALKQQYDGNLACSGHGCCNTPWHNMSNNSGSCLAGPAAVNNGCLRWLEASVSLAAHTMASKLPGVAQARMLLEELAKSPSVQCAKVSDAVTRAVVHPSGMGTGYPCTTRASGSAIMGIRPHSMLVEEALLLTGAAASDYSTEQDWGVAVDLSPCLHLWPEASLNKHCGGDAVLRSFKDIDADHPLQITLPLGAGGVDELLLNVLGSLYAEVSVGDLASWLRQLPHTPLHVPDHLPVEFDDKLQARFINQNLWQLDDMAILMEAFIPRNKQVVAGVDLGPMLWQNPDPVFITKVAEFYNKYILCVCPDIPVALRKQAHLLQQVKPGAIVVQVSRNEEAATAQHPRLEYFRRAGVVLGLSRDSSSREGSTSATASTVDRDSSAGGAGTPAQRQNQFQQHQQSSVLANTFNSSGPSTGGAGVKWRVLWDTLRIGSSTERDVEDLDEDEVLQLMLPIQSHKDFSPSQMTRAENYKISIPDDTLEVSLGVDEQYSLAVSSTGECKRRLVGSCGRLCSRQEMKAVVMRLQEELHEAEPGSEDLAPIMNRYFGPLKGLSKEWTWFQEPHASITGKVLPRRRINMGGGSTQTFASKRSALLFQAGLQYNSSIGHYPDTASEDDRRDPKNWLWKRTEDRHATYWFIALDKLQSPGLQRIVTTWREVQHHLHRHLEAEELSLMPALALYTRVSFADFVLKGVVESSQGRQWLVQRPVAGLRRQWEQPLPKTVVQAMTADDVTKEVQKGVQQSKRAP